ncbi:MAG: hypothetical protein IPO90_05485 [Flavobacteriales bacterium]|nr:hypothetical protein [Flavobacteriales bacterium]
MRYQQVLLLLVCIGVLSVSCMKDEEPRSPVVTIISPGNGFNLALPDTLRVIVDVSGEAPVNSVSFTITDADGIPVGDVLSVVPSANPARIEVDLPLISEFIESGEHTLTVQANSNGVKGKDYRQLNILATPLRLRRVLVISQPDANTVNISIIDSTGALSLANTLQMDLGGAVVSSTAQLIGITGTVQGSLLALASDGVQVDWQKPNMGNSGMVWFTSLDLGDDRRIYSGTADGSVRGYNARSGSTEFVSNISDNYRSTNAQVVAEKVVVAQVDQTGSAWRLGVYQASSGALIADQFLDKDVTGLFRRDDEHLLLFGDRNDQGVVEDRNIAGGGWEPRTWNSTITAVEQVDANTYLVALNSGSLERFTYSNAGSLTLANIANVHDLSLDPVSGTVYAAAGTDVLQVDPQNGQVLATWSIGSEVRYVLPLLNR